MAKYVIEDTTLTNTANAIREKTGKTDNITPSNFATEIANIQSGGGKYTPKFISFSNFTGTDLTEELSNLDTSNVTTMTNMFNECVGLTTLDVSSLNTSRVMSMYKMFGGCNSLTSLILGDFDTSNVTTMTNMFYGCSSLKKLDLSSFDTNKLRVTSYMFTGCTSLTKLIINNPNVFKISATDALSSSSISNGTGYVYVPDNLVETYKSATNWSAYADQIKPISELEANA